MQTGKAGQPVVQSPLAHTRGPTVPEWPSWSIQEAADQTGYHPEYLRRLIRQGKVEAVKIGPSYLIKVESLRTYIDSLDCTDGRTGAKT